MKTVIILELCADLTEAFDMQKINHDHNQVLEAQT